MKRTKYYKIINAVIAIIIFIFTIEICARIDDKIKYNAPILKEYSYKLLLSTDSEGIPYNVPNSQFEKWKINKFGFRGPEIERKKAEGCVRIVCMGTSETFGLYESPQKEWARQMMDVLRNHSNYQVINASVVGLSLKKYRKYLEKYVLFLKPDIVILFVNPFGYAIGEGKKEKINQENKRDKKGKIVRIILEDITSNFRMIPKIKNSMKKMAPPKVLKWFTIHNLKKEINSIEIARLNGVRPIDFVSKESLNEFQNDLKDLIRFLRGKNIEVNLSSYPVLISEENLNEHSEIFLDHRRFYIELSILGILDASKKFNEAIEIVAQENKILFIDNNKYLMKNLKMYADNVHFTDEGAGKIALNIASYIQNNFSKKHDKS